MILGRGRLLSAPPWLAAVALLGGASSNKVDCMTATIQTLLLLLAVLVVVAVGARRLNIAPSILLVIAGCAHARPAAHRAGARTGPARHPAPAHLLGRGRHELARVPVQPAPDHAS